MSYSAIVFGMGAVSLICIFMATTITIPEYSLEELKSDRKKYWDALLSSGLKVLFTSGAILMLILLINSISLISQNEGYSSFDMNVPIDNAYFLIMFIFVVYFTLKIVSIIYDGYNILMSGAEDAG